MPKATHVFITSRTRPYVARVLATRSRTIRYIPPRGGLFASRAGALLAGTARLASAAGAAPVGAGTDFRLLHLCRGFQRHNALIRAWNRNHGVSDEAFEAVLGRWRAAVGMVADLPAQTDAGRLAKAGVLAEVTRDCAHSESAVLAQSLVRDLTAMPAGSGRVAL